MVVALWAQIWFSNWRLNYYKEEIHLHPSSWMWFHQCYCYFIISRRLHKLGIHFKGRRGRRMKIVLLVCITLDKDCWMAMEYVLHINGGNRSNNSSSRKFLSANLIQFANFPPCLPIRLAVYLIREIPNYTGRECSELNPPELDVVVMGLSLGSQQQQQRCHWHISISLHRPSVNSCT